MKEPAELMPRPRIVGRIEVQFDDLWRRGGHAKYAFTKKSSMSRVRATIFLGRLFASAPTGDSSNRLSVLFLASGQPRSFTLARSCPIGSSLPTSTANSGSRRNVSWSLRSSSPKHNPKIRGLSRSCTGCSTLSGSR